MNRYCETMNCTADATHRTNFNDSLPEQYFCEEHSKIYKNLTKELVKIDSK
ncbi:hypothetical protein SEA_AFLAC_74 [Gordonia phage Aflac]|nr:hypothetical protein SEA_JODELIE19_73 [Gordonia phage Jodelie19]QWY82406.1 hypothetical protein SEA_AFLAC_74 [Gordonia phage Aflac]QXO13080.1 hypothetical protein SEA_FIGLIAR_73 [Gordonia phage Figliar]